MDASDPTWHALTDAAGRCEDGFLSMGRDLEAAVGILDRLTDRFAGFIAEFSGEALTKVNDDLATSRDQVLALTEARGADAAALRALGGIVAEAGTRLAALQPIIGEVEILSLTARVVAAGMGHAAADLIAFAENIRTAAQHGRSCLTEACNALAEVDHSLRSAGADAEAFNARHGDAMRAIPARLARNVSGLRAQRQLAADAAAAAHQQSDAIRRQIANQIVALQLGDVIRQRTEHVRDALAIAASPARSLGQLFAAQLADAAETLAHDGDRIESGLREFPTMAANVGQLGARVGGDAEAGGFIVALETDIAQTAVLLGELGASDAGNDQRIGALLDAAAELAAQLARIQFVQEDIRLMGLNASLKCSRLGAIGKPLAAVAQELRLCSGRFGVNAARMLEDLEKLRPIATTLRDPTRRRRHEEFAGATDELLSSLRRMHELEQNFATTLTNLRDDAAEVGRHVGAAIDRFAVRHDLVTTLRRIAAELTAWRNEVEIAPALFDRIAAGYTMAREREVHARFAALPREQAMADDDFLL